MPERRYGFEVKSNREQWKIRLVPESTDPNQFDYYEIGTGLNGELLTLRPLPTEAVRTNNNLANSFTASVLSQPFLDGMDPELRVLVLAFFGDRYLSDTFREFPAFVSYPTSDRRKLPTRWSLKNGTTGPIAEITQTDIGTYPQASARRRPPPFSSGFTNCHYFVSRWLEAGTVSLPGEGTLQTFVPKVNGLNSNDLTRFQSLTLTVTNLTSITEEKSFIPSIPGDATVVFADTRFSDQSVVYSTNRWLSKAEVLALPDYRQQMQGIAIERAASIQWTTRRKLFVSSFAVINCLLLTYFLWKNYILKRIT